MNTKQTEALKLALEALKGMYIEGFTQDNSPINNAITAIREALAEQPAQQEPVAWKHDCAALLTNDVELWIDRCPHCGKPRTTPQPAQQQDSGLTNRYTASTVAKRDSREPEQPAQQQEPVNKYCCHLCFSKSGQMFLDRMILCPECGNKRCPKATHHELPCTNSNEPGQPGSIYTSPQPSKPWVGLTDEEFASMWMRSEIYGTNREKAIALGRAIEAKLKEKNA